MISIYSPLCAFSADFSQLVYNYLSRVFKAKLSFSEVGLTDHLVFGLTEQLMFHRLHDVEIYKSTWPTESKFGNDIDLFIENSSGNYNWYALQAKVMSFNGAFKDLKYNRKALTQQWDKLLAHETKFGSKTYYLLYNGKPKKELKLDKLKPDCLAKLDIDQFGLGLVETNIVKLVRDTISRSSLFYFNNLPYQSVSPFRKLFCCQPILDSKLKNFKKGDINLKGYSRIYESSIDENIIEDQKKTKITSNGRASVLLIIPFKGEVDYNRLEE